MTTIGLTYPALMKLKPCPEGRTTVAELLGGAEAWNGNLITARQAKDAGIPFNDLAWAASAVARHNSDVERRLRLWMADCAARVLHIFESERPADMRVRECIVAARKFARGEIDTIAWASARAAAWDAARAAARDSARASARAAAWAAAGAAAGDAEEAWQFERLIEWLSDPEPDDLALPAILKNEAA